VIFSTFASASCDPPEGAMTSEGTFGILDLFARGSSEKTKGGI
jgi:hypothetical protein